AISESSTRTASPSRGSSTSMRYLTDTYTACSARSMIRGPVSNVGWSTMRDAPGRRVDLADYADRHFPWLGLQPSRDGPDPRSAVVETSQVIIGKQVRHPQLNVALGDVIDEVKIHLLVCVLQEEIITAPDHFDELAIRRGLDDRLPLSQAVHGVQC